MDSAEVDNSEYSCNGSDALSDKQILFQLGGIGTHNTDSNTFISLIFPRFNINNYPGVDSIVYVATIYGTNNTTIELYNVTDSTVIANTALTAGPTEMANAKYQFSGNFYTTFPKKEFALGLKATVDQKGEYGYAGYSINVMMMLYRK